MEWEWKLHWSGINFCKKLSSTPFTPMRKIDLAAIKSRLSEPRPGERKKREQNKSVAKERAE